MPERAHELIRRVEGKLPVGISFGGGGRIPDAPVVAARDFLLHGNSVEDPAIIRDMVRRCLEIEGYRPMPILFNEDDHYRFDEADNNFLVAIGAYASWGFFDNRFKSETFGCGYQSVPANWGISSARKRGFFELAKRIFEGD